ncbi:hypothetical protein OQA88_2524 [Cercophora sp. LCS_1]
MARLITNPAARMALLLFTALLQVRFALATLVSIRSEPAYKAMRECARDCLVWNGSVDLIGELGCVYPYQNECLCRTDLASVASKHLSSCGTTYCTVGPPEGDISMAISVYNSYCVENGFDVTAAPAVAPKTTQAGQGSNPTGAATTGQRAGTGNDQPAATGQSSADGSSGGSGASPGLSTGAMIGIAVSVCSIVVGIIGIVTRVILARKKARENRHQRLGDKF